MSSPVREQVKQKPSNLPNSGVAKFVGRDDVLTRLATQLQTCHRIAIFTLTGMGGIGKSELALQYAQQEYKKNTYLGGITWLNVADSDVGTSILSFAHFLLGLTLPTEGTLEQMVAFCWQNWFKNEKDESLIIFDNVYEYKQIKVYLPPQVGKRFKVIITTRNNNLSAIIQTLQLPVLEENAALDLLRSYVEDYRIDQELDVAKSLCRDLGYLPLALELVARLLRRRNQWSVQDIRRRLSEKGLISLQKDEKFDEEMTAKNGVQAAFDLTWENLDENSQHLAMYLSLFALAPFSKSLIDDLLSEQDPDDIEEWLADNLVNLNLVNDLGNNWYELHTLIRVYLREKLEESVFKDKAKHAYCKAIVGIAKDINQTLTLEDVARLDLYIDHLKIATEDLNEWLEDENLIGPFIGLGLFYQGRGFYHQATPFLEKCLTVSKNRLGENHPNVATSLNNLASLYDKQGRYKEAEPLYRRALSICEQQLGENHPNVATTLNNLAALYLNQGKYTEAEPLYLRSLSIKKKQLGENHPNVATTLNNLALLYNNQGKYTEAEPLYRRALSICEQQLGENHPDLANSLNNLGGLYQAQGKYTEAEPLYRRALCILEQQLGENHPDLANSLNNLGGLYQAQGRYTEAEPLYRRALCILEQQLGENHPNVATILNNLGGLYQAQGRYTEAEPLYRRALSIKKRQLGDNHPNVATSLNDLALLYDKQGRYKEAEPLYRRALCILEQQLGENHPNVATILNNLALLYNNQGRYKEAEPLYKRALCILEQQLGENHPNVATTLKNLATLYDKQGRYTEATCLHLRTITIRPVGK